MSDVKLTAIKKAIGLLHAAGAQYKIVYNDEVLADNLPLPPAEKRKFQKTGVNYVQHFRPFVEALKDPQNSHVRIDVPEPYDVRAYRGALAGYLTKVFGNGSCITSINPENRTVEVLYAR